MEAGHIRAQPRFVALLAAAQARGGAVGAFTCYDLETALGVVEACEEAGRGGVILIAPSTFRSQRGGLLFRALRALTEAANVPIAIQLDHTTEPALADDALSLGADAIMADGSKLGFDANIALVRAVQEAARSWGCAVEAELGRVEGNEDVAEPTLAGAYTDPAEAAEFVRAASPDCLAISIGNVHGTYRQPPRLDYDRLEEIAAATPVPLSLHGASGLGDDDLVRTVQLGVRKVNINTELREAYFHITHETLDEASNGFNLAKLHDAQVEATKQIASQKLALLA
jgi:ketose-bisphosphate aldolase